jgi:hypothetical protein
MVTGNARGDVIMTSSKALMVEEEKAPAHS